MSRVQPHLSKRHEQYPRGFPARLNDDLLGHWPTEDGIVVVENHPHGYEVHFRPCYDFAGCDACAPDRGPSNPHTPDDGHHFRLCENRRGPILTVAGGEEGHRAVLEYLSMEGSAPHVAAFAALLAADAAAIAELRERERVENEAALAEQAAAAPSPEERLAALESEIAALREKMGHDPVAD